MNITRISIILLSLLSGVCHFCFSDSVLTARPTYSKDIAPIINQYCVECHRTGQIAPMSLRTYHEVRPWARSIAKEVSLRNMPPFDAGGPIGYFKNDVRLTENKIALIEKWVEMGAEQGDPSNLPESVTRDDSGWMNGEPDLVVPFPPTEISDDGKDNYAFALSDLIFPEDTWVKGFEWHSSDYGILHHAEMYVVNEGETIDTDKFDSVNAGVGDGYTEIFSKVSLINMGGYQPGSRYKGYPDGQALFFRKGARIVAVFHFAPRDEVVVSDIRLGIYLANGPVYKPTHELISRVGLELWVPAGSESTIIRRTKTLETDALLTHYRLHMHYRGRSFSMTLTSPDGSTETALTVPQYRMDWQQNYILDVPKFVPKGTTVEFAWEWNNSASNPFNPDPTRDVGWGLRSIDEMAGSIAYYTIPGEIMEDAFIAKNGIRQGPYDASTR